MRVHADEMTVNIEIQGEYMLIRYSALKQGYTWI